MDRGKARGGNCVKSGGRILFPVHTIRSTVQVQVQFTGTGREVQVRSDANNISLLSCIIDYVMSL